MEFEYESHSTATVDQSKKVDPAGCSLPLAIWESLKEAANRYSLTALKKAMEPLENNGEASKRKAAEQLQRLIHEGDFDQVSAFLEELKEKEACNQLQHLGGR